MSDEVTTESTDGLSILVHGQSKSGKSWLSDTGPTPRLCIDAEGGNAIKWTPSRKKSWDPTTEAPPVPDGTWDTCVVNARDFETVTRAYEWLNSGQHPFNTVSLDSVSEIQQRCVDSLAGVNQMKQQDWGSLLRMVSSLIRNFRDLPNHPIKPVRAVLFIAMTKNLNGKFRPYVQGSLADSLPYYPDVCGYVMVTPPDEMGACHRYFMIQPSHEYFSGERVGGRLGPYVHIPNGDQTVERMLDMVYNPQTEEVNT